MLPDSRDYTREVFIGFTELGIIGELGRSSFSRVQHRGCEPSLTVQIWQEHSFQGLSDNTYLKTNPPFSEVSVLFHLPKKKVVQYLM